MEKAPQRAPMRGKMTAKLLLPQTKSTKRNLIESASETPSRCYIAVLLRLPRWKLRIKL